DTAARRRAPRPIMLDREPAEFLALRLRLAQSDTTLAIGISRALTIVHWPGQPGYQPPPPPAPLTVEQQKQYEVGRAVYTATCAQCHKATGLGQEGLAPPLVDSEWALDLDRRMARIILHGVTGPITVAGRT